MAPLQPIDFRSDTVTRPGAAMRRAMAEAQVGDDVYGEDPTVNRLQAVAADLLGKEAALFFPSGSMANQAALRAHTRPGDCILAAQGCHILWYEAGAAAGLSGLQIKTLGALCANGLPGGAVSAADVAAGVHPAGVHQPRTPLLSLENTHNSAGGRVVPQAQVVEAAAEARRRGLALHLDGARIFNAAVAQGKAAAELAAPFDTVSFCLSKGLGAPVGSLVAGPRAAADELLRQRKMLGGGMRQAGVLAAAGIYALQNNVQRLQHDHENARALAEGLQQLGLEIAHPPETNMVLFRAAGAGDSPAGGAALQRALGEARVLANGASPGWLRAVTHLDVSAANVKEALSRLARVWKH